MADNEKKAKDVAKIKITYPDGEEKEIEVTDFILATANINNGENNTVTFANPLLSSKLTLRLLKSELTD